MATHQIKMPVAALAVAVMVSLVGCDQIGALLNKDKVGGDNPNALQAAAQGGKKMPPPPMVDVITAKPQTLTRTTNLPARLAASRKAVIVPRVSGIVEKRLFEEGSTVKAGQLLYQLDKGTFVAALKHAEGNLTTANASIATAEAGLTTARANLKSAKASVGQSVAQRDLAQKTVTRYRKLITSKAVSQQELDQARANLNVQQSNVNVADASIATANAGITSAKATINAANASIASAQAGVETAKINLSYTAITAPIDGVIGVSHITEGAYVLASQTPMADIQQLDPLYVNITQPASAIMQLRKAQQANVAKTGNERNIQIVLENGSVYPHKGRLLFVNQAVNESTGEMTIRAEVPNPDGELIPGLYVRVNVPQERLENAYLIPQQAVTRGKIDIVMVAEADGSFHPQPVKISGQQNQDWIVTGGLQPGMTVIVDGMGQLAIKMGAPKVQTRPWGKPEAMTKPTVKPVKSKATKSIGNAEKATSENSTNPSVEPRNIELISDKPESSGN